MKMSSLVSRRNGLVEEIGKVAKDIATVCDESKVDPWDVPPEEDCDRKAIEEELRHLGAILRVLRVKGKRLKTVVNYEV